MKTTIYGCTLLGENTYAYIGSHNAETHYPVRDGIYVGQGIFINKEGLIISSRDGDTGTLWVSKLFSMTAAERVMMTVESLALVSEPDRWSVERELIQKHNPPFNYAHTNKEVRSTKNWPSQKREKWNSYIRGYLPEYYKRNPDKLEAKKKADRERIKAKRELKKHATYLERAGE